MTVSDWEFRKYIRLVFIEKIYEVIRSSDPSLNSLTGGLNVLYLISSNFDEISYESSVKILETCKIILEMGLSDKNFEETGLVATRAVDAAVRVYLKHANSTDLLLDIFTLYNSLRGTFSSNFEFPVEFLSSLMSIESGPYRFLLNRPQALNATYAIVTAPSIDCFAEKYFDSVEFSSGQENSNRLGITSLSNRLSKPRDWNSNILVLDFMLTKKLTNYSVVVALNNNAPQTYEPYTESRLVYSIFTSCARGELKVTNYTCPMSGYIVTHNCTGLAGRFVTECPSITEIYSPVCEPLGGPGIVCTTKNYSSLTTWCMCTLMPASNAVVSGFETRFSVSIGAKTKGELQYDVPEDVFYESQSNQRPSVVVFATFSLVWVIFALLVYFRGVFSNKTVAVISNTDEENDENLQTIENSCRSKVKSWNLVRSSIPEYFERSNGVALNYSWHLHLWVKPFLNLRKSETFDGSSFRTPVVKLLVHNLTALFLTSMIVYLSVPDDTFCQDFINQSLCNQARTSPTSIIPRCRWNKSSGCESRYVSENLSLVIIMAIIVCCLAIAAKSILSLIVDYSWSIVRLRSPSHPDDRKSWTQLIRSSAGPRASSVAPMVEDDMTPTFDRDFDFINKGLIKRRNWLSTEDQRVYCSLWGINTGYGDVGLPYPRDTLINRITSTSVDAKASLRIARALKRAIKQSEARLREMQHIYTYFPAAVHDKSMISHLMDSMYLQTLFADLMPQREAILAQSGFEKLFRLPLIVHDVNIKVIAISLLITTILGSSGACLVFGVFRSHATQMLWLSTYLTWVFLDAVLIQSTYAALFGYGIYSLTQNFALRAKRAIFSGMTSLSDSVPINYFIPSRFTSTSLVSCEFERNDAAEPGPARNLSLMFFASARLASFLHSTEVSLCSMDLVCKYALPHPVRKWNSDPISIRDLFTVKFLTCGIQTISVFLLSNILSLPSVISSCITEFLILFFWIAVAMLHAHLYAIQASAPVWIPSLLGAAVVVFSIAHALFVGVVYDNKHYATVDVDPVFDDAVPATVPSFASAVGREVAVRTTSQVAPDATEESSPLANQPFVTSNEDINGVDNESVSSDEIRPAEEISSAGHAATVYPPVEQTSEHQLSHVLPVVVENRDETIELWPSVDTAVDGGAEGKIFQTSDEGKEEKLDDILADVASHGAGESQALWQTNDTETDRAPILTAIEVSTDIGAPGLSVPNQSEASTDIFFDGDDIFAGSRVTTAQSKINGSFDGLFLSGVGVEPRPRTTTEELFFASDAPASASAPLEPPVVVAAGKEGPAATRTVSQAGAATTTRTAAQVLSSPFDDNIFTEADDRSFAPLFFDPSAADPWTFDAPQGSIGSLGSSGAVAASPVKGQEVGPDMFADPLKDFKLEDLFSPFAADVTTGSLVVKPGDSSDGMDDPWRFDPTPAGGKSDPPMVLKQSGPLASLFDDVTTESASFDVGSGLSYPHSPASAPLVDAIGVAKVDSDEWFAEAPSTKSGRKRHGYSTAARLREENLSRIAKTYGLGTTANSPRSVENRTGPLFKSPRTEDSSQTLHSLTFAAGSFDGSPFFDSPSIDLLSSPTSGDARHSPAHASNAASAKRPHDMQPRRLSSMNDLREELNLRRMRENEVREARRRMQEQLLAIQQAKQDYPPKQGSRK
jgi:hypothetical protein